MSTEPLPLPTLSAPEGTRITRAQVKVLAQTREAGSVTAYAKATGLMATTVRILLAGGRPKASTIAKLAPHGVSPADWFEPADITAGTVDPASTEAVVESFLSAESL